MKTLESYRGTRLPSTPDAAEKNIPAKALAPKTEFEVNRIYRNKEMKPLSKSDKAGIFIIEFFLTAGTLAGALIAAKLTLDFLSSVPGMLGKLLQ